MKNINNTLANLKLNNIDINFNTNLKDLNSQINNVYDNLKTNFSKISSMNTTFVDGEAVKNVTNLKDEFNNTLKIVNDLSSGTQILNLGSNFEKQEKELEKFNKKIEEFRIGLSAYNVNDIIKKSTIKSMSNDLNKLDFFTSTEEDLKKFEDRFNRLASSESGVVKTKNLLKELQDGMKELKLDQNFKNIDTSNFDSAIKELTKLKDKYNNNTTDTLTKARVDSTINNAKESYKEIERQVKEYDNLANAMAKVREQSELKSNKQNDKDELSQINAINKALEEEYKQKVKINSELNNSQAKLNVSKDNGFVNNSVINEAQNNINALQNVLNNLNTDKAEKEINELLLKITQLSKEDLGKMTNTDKLNTAIKSVKSNVDNISKSSSQIVSLNKTISTLENNLTSLKNKYDKLVSINPEQLGNFNDKLQNLKNISKDLQNGKIIDGQKIANECNIARDSFSQLQNEVKKDGFKTGRQDVTSFGEAIKNAFGNVGIYYGTTTAIREIFSAMKQGVQDVISVESAFVSLRRIVDMTDESADKLRQEFGQMALGLATSTTEITNSITDYAKLGYTLEEAKTLATETQKFNLAGDINNLSEATTDTVSTLKGFGLEAKNVTEVLDAENTASNKYAVSARDIAEILKRSASSLKVAGNDYKQSIALGTVAQEVNLNCLLYIEIYNEKLRKKTGRLSLFL